MAGDTIRRGSIVVDPRFTAMQEKGRPMPALELAVAIADATRDPERLADIESTAGQLHLAHPEAEVEHSAVVAALIAAGESMLPKADDSEA